MPGVFHPNLLIYCRSEGVTFTEARRRKERDHQIQLSFISAQMLWGSMAAKMYASERLVAPLLVASHKLTPAALMSLFAFPQIFVASPLGQTVGPLLVCECVCVHAC